VTSLLEFLATCNSVRNFTRQPVPDEQIDQILDVARWTGSARNRQPWRFLSVTDREVQHCLSQLGQYAHHLADAPLVLVLLSADNAQHDTEFDLGRIAQTISLAAHSLGLGSCLATLYPTENIAEAIRILRIEPGWLPRHAMSLGWPAVTQRSQVSALPTGRLSVTELVSGVTPT
jgi:nitroreductase